MTIPTIWRPSQSKKKETPMPSTFLFFEVMLLKLGLYLSGKRLILCEGGDSTTYLGSKRMSCIDPTTNFLIRLRTFYKQMS